MKKTILTEDIYDFAELDLIYDEIRLLEAKQNQSVHKCLGSGSCCRIGLVLPLIECAHIAFRIHKQHRLITESSGIETANKWISDVIDALKSALYDDSWREGGISDKHCSFYKNGCTIYEYRPMICRSFGTITEVSDSCPRIRNSYGSINVYSGTKVENLIKNFQHLMNRFANRSNEKADGVTYMPIGVLRFFLDEEEMNRLKETTDSKFWNPETVGFSYSPVFIEQTLHIKKKGN